VAFAAQDIHSALDEGLAVLGYASGPTVGAFLLAVLTKRAGPWGTLGGMAAGLAASLLASRLLGVAWTWNVAVGAVVTFTIGLSASGLGPRAEARA